jgi:acetyltransferase-like isoleucine patch superfamily enzyme
MKSLLSSLIFRFYQLFNFENRIKFLSRIENIKLGGFNLIESNCDLKNLSIGKLSYLAKKVYIRNCEIGNFCSIGPNVMIGLGEHPIEYVSTHPVFYTSQGQLPLSFNRISNFNEYKKTVIGNDVWVGANVIIKAGITIGDGSIIAAGSIVAKNIESYSIVGGIPAKFIRNRFSDYTITKLRNLKWWNWEIEKIKERSKEFLSPELLIKNNEIKESPHEEDN